MTCWSGHIPRMNDNQMRQAVHAYYAAYDRAWTHAWQSPVNPLRDVEHEPPDLKEPARTTSLPEASASDKAGAIDVVFTRVR